MHGLERLYPDECLELSKGATSSVSRRLLPLGSVEQAADTLADALVQTVRQASERFDRLWLSLTGGSDSRTLLAAPLQAGVPFEAVTLTIKDATDAHTASKLCTHLGVAHRVMTPDAYRRELLDAWHQHTLGSYDGADNRVLLPTNQHRFLGPDDAILRGGCLELGRRSFAKPFRGLSLDLTTDKELWLRLSGEPHVVDSEVESLDAWLTWPRRHDNGLDLVDAFDIDQDQGAWQASIEQGFDLRVGTSLNPGNDAAVYGALLSGDEASRTGGAVQDTMMRRADPRLLDIPINPTLLRVRARRRLRWLKHRAELEVRRLRASRQLGAAERAAWTGRTRTTRSTPRTFVHACRMGSASAIPTVRVGPREVSQIVRDRSRARHRRKPERPSPGNGRTMQELRHSHGPRPADDRRPRMPQ